jgi:magnesium chelatase family protein
LRPAPPGLSGQEVVAVSLAIVLTRALAGMQAPLVRVEVHVGPGLPGFHVVGLPETEVREARDRVRAALLTSRFQVPQWRVTVSLAPADLPKESGRFDLPIALGILAASSQVPLPALDGLEFAGELALSGELRPVRGALAMAFAAHRDGHAFVLPESSAAEAALVPGAIVHPAPSLAAVCAHLTGRERLMRLEGAARANGAEWPDLADVKGQAQARRALEIAAAGGHSLLLAGPPGTGKTMLAQRLPGILPPMSQDEALESAALQSISTRGFAVERFGVREWRSPHHTASAVALVGGGSPPRPGEISLAHHGVLFLDELPEFSRHVLEVLREPMESGRISISRAATQAEFPARFQLVAAMNPCPCGYLGHYSGRCACTPDRVANYRSRISGPLLDRIDLHVEVPALRESALADSPAGEPSAAVRARVEAAHRRQLDRQGRANASLAGGEIDRHCAPDAAALALLREAASRLSLSARAFHRVLKVARTIADLGEDARPGAAHVAEALQYRLP